MFNFCTYRTKLSPWVYFLLFFERKLLLFSKQARFAEAATLAEAARIVLLAPEVEHDSVAITLLELDLEGFLFDLDLSILVFLKRKTFIVVLRCDYYVCLPARNSTIAFKQANSAGST